VTAVGSRPFLIEGASEILDGVEADDVEAIDESGPPGVAPREPGQDGRRRVASVPPPARRALRARRVSRDLRAVARRRKAEADARAASGRASREDELAFRRQLSPDAGSAVETRVRPKSLDEVALEDDLVSGLDAPVEPHPRHLTEITFQGGGPLADEDDARELRERLDQDHSRHEWISGQVIFEHPVAFGEEDGSFGSAERVHLEHVVHEQEGRPLRQELDEVVVGPSLRGHKLNQRSR
jgi:hypothetical protein